MAFGVLLGWALLVVPAVRRMERYRRHGLMPPCRRCYRRMSLLLGGGMLAALLAQEVILALSHRLNVSSGLPLHLCSALGILTLPMLLTRRPFLFHAAVYLGIPGGMAALLFPAMVTTRYPTLYALAFNTLHALLVLSPLLPMALGIKPDPRGIWQAGLMLLLLAWIALPVNALTGSNYLFLNLPARGTPLGLLAQGGVWAYRGKLVLLCLGVLVLEGVAVSLLLHRGFRRSRVRLSRG